MYACAANVSMAITRVGISLKTVRNIYSFNIRVAKTILHCRTNGSYKR